MSPTGKRTLTPLELAARRRNAQKSTGPRTAAGKFRSSLNALKRGLCPFIRERMIEFRGEDVREYRRLHRDLINLLLPEDFYLADRIADLAEACWDKVCALRASPWDKFREQHIWEAEERIEEELDQLVQALSLRSRKWRYRLEQDAGRAFNSLSEVRDWIESRLPIFVKASEAIKIASRFENPKRFTCPYNKGLSKAAILLTLKALHKMSGSNEPKAVIPARISEIGVKSEPISGNIRSLGSDVCSTKS
jgi:hypothetical protein